MLLTIKTTHNPATDLGYLLHKHPQRHHEFSLSCGKAHVFFPAAKEDHCIAALLLDIDPIALVRKGKDRSHEGFSLEQYVNDRPYVASSFLSMALAKVFRSAMKGVCKEKPDLCNTSIPLEVSIAALPCKSENGKQLLLDLFEPLGYEVEIQEHLLDKNHPEWKVASHYTVTLRRCCRLKDFLAHIYVLIPVLDNDKHYWVSKAEIDKLLSYGEGWLSGHPQKEFIITRYLKKQKALANEAIGRLVEREKRADNIEDEPVENNEKVSFHKLRMGEVLKVLKEHKVKRIADLGCGEGVLLKLLLEDSSFHDILGVDVSYKELERAKIRLNWDRLPPAKLKRIQLVQGSLNYTDKRIVGFDAVTLIEVIEHLDPSKLSSLEHVVFGFAKPKTIVVTTPNSEYNANFDNLPKGSYRHKDHRFEWTRNEFQLWADQMADQYGYSVFFKPVGPEDDKLGAPTQMGIFTKQEC